MELISKVPDIKDKELCTLFSGKDVPEDELTIIKERISKMYQDIELVCYEGGQNVYSYLISFE
jgi:dihydroxyacetone kinase-like predicted kinase